MSFRSRDDTHSLQPDHADGQEEGTTRSGTIPTSTGILLLIVAVSASFIVGVTAGFPAVAVGAITVGGILAGIGVRLSASNRLLPATVGAVLLWVGAIAALADTGILLLNIHDSRLVRTIGIVYSIGAALVPFCLIAGMHRDFGYGLGASVIARYFAGVAILGLLTTPFLFPAALQATGDLSSVDIGTGASPGELIGVILGLVLFILAVWGVRHAIKVFPVEPFVAPDHLSRAVNARTMLTGLLGYGWYLAIGIFGVYLAASRGAAIAGVPAGEPAAQLIVTVLTHVAFLVITGAVLAGSLAIIATVRFVQRARTITPSQVAATLTPPLLTTAISWTIVLGPGDAIAERIESNVETATGQTSGVLPEFAANYPAVVILLTVTAALLVVGFAFLLPSYVVRRNVGDPGLVGVTGGVVSLVVVVGIGAVTAAPAPIVVLGALAAVFVWELGEFSIVAAGELRLDSHRRTMPRGYGTLATVHVLVVGGIVAAAASIAAASTLIASGIALTTATTMTVIVLCGIALAVTAKLLPA